MHRDETWYVCLLHHFQDDYMFPWQPRIVWKSLRQFSIQLLLHSSNLLTVARMEVKLGAHVYYIVSMTTTTNSLRHLSSKIFLHSSNLLTLDPGDLKSRNFIGPIFCLKLIISTRLACSCTALKQPQFSFVPCFRYLSHVKFNWKNA